MWELGLKGRLLGLLGRKLKPSIKASTRAKLSSVSSSRRDGSGKLKTTFCCDKREDLRTSVLLLKWSAKSSHRVSVGCMGDLLKSALIKRSVVEKRVLGLFLLSEMIFVKWLVLASFVFLHFLSALLQFLFNIFISEFLHRGIDLVFMVWLKVEPLNQGLTSAWN